MTPEGDLKAQIARETAHLAELDRQRAAVTARLTALRAQLPPPDGDATPLTAGQKVALFRRLFVGRPEVHAVRWENTRSGGAGYAPACRNEWVHGVCEKPKVRCGDCTRQAVVPYSDKVVRAHLQGRLVAGVYPLLADDSCWFCAIDLDGPGWREDAATVKAVPRGCLDDLRELLGGLGITLEIEDRRSPGAPLATRFLGELRTDQQAAVNALANHETGVLVAPPGAGKTVMAAAPIAHRQTSTLVVVPTRELMRQWEARLAAFLELADGRVGVIGGGRRRPTRGLDVAIIQSLVRGEELDPGLAEYGHIVVDECHHVPAVSTERLLAATPARLSMRTSASWVLAAR